MGSLGTSLCDIIFVEILWLLLLSGLFHGKNVFKLFSASRVLYCTFLFLFPRGG